MSESKIISLEEKKDEKKIKKLLDGLFRKYTEGQPIVDEYYDRLMNDPIEAIDALEDFIKRTRDINPERAYVEAVAGGPNHSWSGPILDVLGIIYSSLDKELRGVALKKVLSFLDGLRYDNSQDHVEYINDPWLTADIIINRPFYYCGYMFYVELLAKHRTWKDFYNNTRDVKSEFWLAFAVIQPKFSTKEIRKNYYKFYPDLLDRTLDATAAILNNIVVCQVNNDKTVVLDPDKLLGEELSKFDWSLHKKIKEKITESKWIKI